MAVKEGGKAPAFKGVDQDGKTISLADYKGKKVVMFFYPRDNTPTCTVQACNLRDNFGLLQQEGFHVIGISTDSVKSHKKFEQKFSLPFPLIADEDLVIVQKYDVWGEKKFMGKTFDGIHRTTFIIDEEGKIRKIIKKPNTKDHAQEIITAWNDSLGG
ncbi:thioredoxin-dependent thiol peroxidase [Aridibaculum aurantiacum]|uniref:thioredoxin-dependent thiol peroxidase n=1 Tax=Aridibaculum aurantiacum TaxID=2810307 RepID=UPI001A966E1A|nr:thioredoxin-dependent thiol peroxidase [Aridibaculum aurantiacum]